MPISSCRLYWLNITCSNKKNDSLWSASLKVICTFCIYVQLFYLYCYMKTCRLTGQHDVIIGQRMYWRYCQNIWNKLKHCTTSTVTLSERHLFKRKKYMFPCLLWKLEQRYNLKDNIKIEFKSLNDDMSWQNKSFSKCCDGELYFI